MTPYPVFGPPAIADGFRIEKRLYTLQGALADPQSLTQGDRVIVAISGEAQADRVHPALLVDLLPAGLEIEAALTSADGAADYGGGGQFAWLGAITPTRAAEARDDRFVAAADVSGGQSFTFAYIARAVTPGRYAAPGAQVEDMYRPGVLGRTASGAVAIAPSGG